MERCLGKSEGKFTAEQSNEQHGSVFLVELARAGELTAYAGLGIDVSSETFLASKESQWG